MHLLDYQILETLNRAGNGVMTSLNDVLENQYPDVIKQGRESILNAANEIKGKLGALERDGLLKLSEYRINHPKSLGTSTELAKNSWLNDINILAAITDIGRQVFEKEASKEETRQLFESTIATNESVRKTNDAVLQNFRFQERTQNLTLFIGFVSLAFIVLSFWQSCNDKTADELRGIKEELQKNRQEIERLKPAEPPTDTLDNRSTADTSIQ